MNIQRPTARADDEAMAAAAAVARAHGRRTELELEADKRDKMAMLTAHNLADEDPVLLESLEQHFQNSGLERLRLMPEVPESEGTGQGKLNTPCENNQPEMFVAAPLPYRLDNEGAQRSGGTHGTRDN